MNQITYTDSLDEITAAMLDGGFFEGWPNAPTPDRHLDLLRGSYRVALALDTDTGKVVGFANAISDGVLTAYIPLLEVLPEYREHGIATTLMTRLFSALDMYMVDLSCDEGLVPFYQRLGMERSNAMAKRNYELQSG